MIHEDDELESTQDERDEEDHGDEERDEEESHEPHREPAERHARAQEPSLKENDTQPQGVVTKNLKTILTVIGIVVLVIAIFFSGHKKKPVTKTRILKCKLKA